MKKRKTDESWRRGLGGLKEKKEGLLACWAVHTMNIHDMFQMVLLTI